MLTIRQLRYFEALSRTLHFGRAARTLNISQPALSAQIQQMEAFFGGPLFERGSQGVALTRDGKEIAARVRRILDEVRELEGAASGAKSLLAGRFSLGIIATVAPYMIPRFLKLLGQEKPEANCVIREGTTERLLAELISGEIDVALVALPIVEPGLEVLPVMRDHFHLAIPASQAGRHPEAISADTLKGESLILLDEGHCLREHVLKLCSAGGPSRTGGLGATSLPTVLRMVAGGLGTTLIPEIAIADEIRRGDIAVVPFEPPAPARTLALAFRPTANQRPAFADLAGIVTRSLRT